MKLCVEFRISFSSVLFTFLYVFCFIPFKIFSLNISSISGVWIILLFNLSASLQACLILELAGLNNLLGSSSYTKLQNIWWLPSCSSTAMVLSHTCWKTLTSFAEHWEEHALQSSQTSFLWTWHFGGDTVAIISAIRNFSRISDSVFTLLTLYSFTNCASYKSSSL